MPARKVVSDRQFEVLVSFMEVNRGFAVGRLANNGPLAKREAEQLWKELAMTLNAVGAGATKTKAKWRDSQRQLPPLQADVPTPPPQLAPTRRRSAIIYCNATYDGFLCWPPTLAGHTVSQYCPSARLSDTSRQAFRRCDSEGFWLGRRANESSQKGWTNYTPCFPTELQKLLHKVNYDENLQDKIVIAQNTRYLEIVGFSTSLLALLISLFIFSHYKSLRNSRTNIHRNLFMAMTIQVFIRLTIYANQAIIRDQPDMNFQGLDGIPYLCEMSYILLEYAVSSMFMWMFIEGLFLHSMVTANVLRERSYTTLFHVIGWGLPVIVTTVWIAFTAVHYKKSKECWYGYNFLPEYWCLQGPRLAVILINLYFLLNIMGVLITKLNKTENNELAKVKKAAKAALVLLPLLGITNILNMIEPVTGAVWKFAFWCYFTHFLRSFQGLFIAVIYCFLNGEVNTVVKKSYRDRIEERRDAERSQRNASAERELPSRWWHNCMEAILPPFRRVHQWMRHRFLLLNAVQDVEIGLANLREDMQRGGRRNYADPYIQSLLEEIRYEQDRIVIATNY